MTNVVENTFTEGMHRDIDKSFMSNKAYLGAKNFRIVTTEGSTTGALENVLGMRYIVPVGGDVVTTGQRIIGSCEIRDKIVLFTTNNIVTNPTTGRSQIYVMEVDVETEEQDSLTLIYDDNLNDSGGYLKFSTAYPIKTVSKYETPNIQKVYWTDGYNHVRFINIAKNQTVTGGVYDAGVNDYMSVDKFEFLPKFNPSKPALDAIVSGSIKSGVVQYSYQLYQLNGAETAFSSPSDLIHVVSDSDFLSNTIPYEGDKESVTTGKGFIIEIDNTDNVGFNRLRLIRIHYPTLDAVPTISVCAEIDISTAGGTVKVTDSGSDVNFLTIDEFNIASTELFSCEDMASKDNILFTANITKTEFDIAAEDYDCRAVRFRSSGIDGTAYLWNAADEQITINSDLSGWTNYLLDHDGINKFNDTDNDGQVNYEFKYQADGSTLGAEGPNIKIGFDTESFALDTSNLDYTYYSTVVSGESYSNFASPFNSGRLSWQRDEVYRLFIVFSNDRGQTSFPKWICDLRMPSLHEGDYSHLSDYIAGLTSTYSTSLFPTIYFKTPLPTGAVSAQVYRVKREARDRSILTQGLVIPNDNIVDLNPGRVDGVNDIADGLVKIISPEILVTRNVAKGSSDYLDYVTYYTGNKISNDSYTICKCIDHHQVVASTDNIAPVVDAIAIGPTDGFVVLNSIQYLNARPVPLPSASSTFGSSGLLVAHDNTTTWTLDGTTYAVVNYKTKVFSSQYGGNTYEARAQNTCIPCSRIIYTDGVTHNIRGGDTFINYFSVATLIADLSFPTTFNETVYVPLESSINLDLIDSVSSPHKMWNVEQGYKNSTSCFLMQEYAGEHVIYDESQTYEQTDDLYTYNTVYSQESTVRYAVAQPLDKILETDFDCMVKASNEKINGELSDSWTKFGINEYIEVDSAFGPITGIKNINDTMLFWQERGFGVLAINDRSLITDNSSSKLVLGTGGILDRYTYISDRVGCLHKFSIVRGKSGVYWYDKISNTVQMFTEALHNLSKEKDVQSLFDDYYNKNYKVIATYDLENDEILFTFFENTVTNGYTISYNEMMGFYVSEYTFIPNLYIPFKNKILSTTSTYYSDADFNMDRVFLHNSEINDRCYFYGLTHTDADKYADSTLTLLFNPDYTYTKVFDNLYFLSNLYNKLGNEVYDVTFNKLECYNDHQYTGEVSLIFGTNLKRRERTWNLPVPRNIVSLNVSTDPDIFTNTNSARTFKERLRDKYMITEWTFPNDGVNAKFTVNKVGASYRLSYR